jgi:transcriptional regulator with XRE-family HTH domain
VYETSKLRGRIVEKYGSQSKFAEKVGCSLSFLSQYLNGKKKLDQPTIDKWVDALDIESSDIYGYFFVRKVLE